MRGGQGAVISQVWPQMRVWDAAMCDLLQGHLSEPSSKLLNQADLQHVQRSGVNRSALRKCSCSDRSWSRGGSRIIDQNKDSQDRINNQSTCP